MRNIRACTMTIVLGLLLAVQTRAGAQQIASVNPDHANPGESGISVVATLSSTVQLPPSNVSPDSMEIGSLIDYSPTYDGAAVTGTFDFPSGMADGTYDVTVTFPTPGGTVSFISQDGFAVGNASTQTSGGVVLNDPGAWFGYTLFAPMDDTQTHLMDLRGNIVQTWQSAARPNLSVYLLDNGWLVRTYSTATGGATFSGGGGVEVLDTSGDLKWSHEYAATDPWRLHHDVEALPNGNLLLLVQEKITEVDAIAAGRDPSLIADGELWVDALLEIDPSGTSGGTIVWQWRVWDHLIQDHDATKQNYGTVADHPELINVNYLLRNEADWTHANGIDYNADLDQVLITARNFSEAWIIDHDTTTAEATESAGDLLYRWGNPTAYDNGTATDQKLFVPHNAHWIESDKPGAGNILVFNNGQGRSGGDYSSVDEFIPPVNPDGTYTYTTGAYGPANATWTYAAPTPTDFYADHISGAQRLPNGNTLICEGTAGTFFEVTSTGTIVWKYIQTGGSSNEVFRAERYDKSFAGVTAQAFDDPTDIGARTYPVVDTMQDFCADNDSEIAPPAQGEAIYGQDAQYHGLQARYLDNGNGTVTDLVTGLVWQQTPNLDNKATFNDAVADAATLNLASYDDWRLPSIKELYSLMDFRGSSAWEIPYLDTGYFDFVYGDEAAGERIIDAQYWSATEYCGYTYGDTPTVFGVNFADGRIKGYPKIMPNGSDKTMFVRYVRGNTSYGLNNFTDNGDATVTDQATGLMWTQDLAPGTYLWQDALAYAESATTAGHDDWRLPNAKELQGIVDYTRAPAATDSAKQSAAINPIFNCSDEENWCWTGTTFTDNGTYNWAVYVTFGRAWGHEEDPPGSNIFIRTDVHGAGAQRSDPKTGNPDDYPDGFGPQYDEIRIYNHVRLVRDAAITPNVVTSSAADWLMYR